MTVCRPTCRPSSIAAPRPRQAWLWELLTRRIEQNNARLEANKVTIVANDRVSPELRAALVQAASGAIENWKQQAGPEAAAVLDAQRR